MSQPTPLGRFPFSVEAAPSESIPSLLHRLAAASGYTVRELFPHELIVLYDGFDVRRIEAAATVLGIDADDLIENHTLRGQFRANDLKLAQTEVRDPEGLRCPGCGVTPVWARLVWFTTCPRCHLILTGSDEKLPAPTAAIDLQYRYVVHRLAKGSNGARFERMARLIRLYACLRLDPPDDFSQPEESTTEAAVKRGALTANDWKSPRWIAGVAGAAWHHASCDTLTEAHAVQIALISTAGDLGTTPAELDERYEVVASLRAALQAQIIRDGLTTDNIPNYLLGELNSLEVDCHTQMIGAAIADALMLEIISLERRRKIQWKRMDNRYYGRRDSWLGEALVEALRYTPPGLRLLAMKAENLVNAGKSDFELRRKTLRGLRAVPRSPLLRAGLPTDQETAEMAATWIWVELAQCTVGKGGSGTPSTAKLTAFARSLGPEAKLILLEYGQARLDAIETDVRLAPHRAARTDAGHQEAGWTDAV